MKFKLVEQFDIQEAYYNKLYHGTTINNANKILSSGTIELGKQFAGGRNVCFSRSFDFVKKFDVIFVFNRDKLNSRYKLKPVTDYKNFRGNLNQARFTTGSKAEEVTTEPVTNIFKYLDCVVIDDKFYNDKYNDDEIKVVPKSQYKR